MDRKLQAKLTKQVMDEVATWTDVNFQASPTKALERAISRAVNVGYEAFANTWGVVDPE